jgi:NAD(P)-dependent dehydrogenase (short-subunit alcohol dehydrogenase family)
MPTVMITGAGRGLGLEFARQYVADGWTVIATCRDPAGATDLKALGGKVEVLSLDVADFAAVRRLGETLQGRAIEILINNAGVIGSDRNLGDLEGERWMATLRVNTVAPILIAQSLLPNLRAGREKKAIFLTSLMGSIADNSSGRYYDYRSSKAGLNAAVRSFAIDTQGDGITAIVIHPGWVKTDMGGPSAPTDAVTSVGGMRKVIAGLKAADSGRFFGHDGRKLAW